MSEDLKVDYLGTIPMETNWLYGPSERALR